MPARDVALFAIYLNFGGLQKCMDCLNAIGVRSNDVEILLPGQKTSRNAAGAMNWERSPNKVSVNGSLAAARELWGPTTLNVSSPGMLQGTLMNLGIAVYDVERYENRIENGGVLVRVRCAGPGWLGRVREILSLTGAEDICLSREARLQASALVGQVMESTYAPIGGGRPPFIQPDATAGMMAAKHA